MSDPRKRQSVPAMSPDDLRQKAEAAAFRSMEALAEATRARDAAESAAEDMEAVAPPVAAAGEDPSGMSPGDWFSPCAYFRLYARSLDGVSDSERFAVYVPSGAVSYMGFQAGPPESAAGGPYDAQKSLYYVGAGDWYVVGWMPKKESEDDPDPAPDEFKWDFTKTPSSPEGYSPSSDDVVVKVKVLHIGGGPSNKWPPGIRQLHLGAIAVGGGGGDVAPDDVSTEFIPGPEEGEEPDGDEGRLQVKGWKSHEALSSSVGEILSGDGGTDEEDEEVVVRQADGTLAYRKLGTVTVTASCMWIDPSDDEPDSGE